MKSKLAVATLATMLSGGWLAVAQPAHAHQPNAVDYDLLTRDEHGSFLAGHTPGGDHQLKVRLFAGHDAVRKSHLLVIFPGCQADTVSPNRPVSNLDELIKDKSAKPDYLEAKETGPRWQICTRQDTVLLRPGGDATMEVAVDFLRPVSEGMTPRLKGVVYEIPESAARNEEKLRELAKEMQKLHPAADVTIDLYYRLNARSKTWRQGDYRSIFGAAKEGPKVTRDYAEVFGVMPVDVTSFRLKRRIPGGEPGYRGSLKQVLERVRQAGSGLAEIKGNINPAIPGLPGNRIDPEVSRFRNPALLRTRDDPATRRVFTRSAHSHTLSGRFSTRWSSDHSLHPGFGFRVEAWSSESGSWQKLASDWIQYDGRWELKVPASLGFAGNHLRVLYRSYNEYYKPQDQDGSTYSWRDPDRYGIGPSFDSGHRYADTDGGEYNGVGELVESAMVMWSRLYWDGNINPLDSDPYDLYFPNTWFDCGDGSGVPWSCANTAGEIWLIASHGTQADVVGHELAHQLNNKFWDNKRPAGSGGSHQLNSCYPSRLGMAMREGFANFIPAWVGYPVRNVATGNFDSGRWALGLDPERRTSPPNCSNGWKNEVWAARTFWDLHDTRGDGQDILWFNHKGAVPALYLASGIANDGDAMDMRDLESVFRSAASSGHEQYISDIFDQNRM